MILGFIKTKNICSTIRKLWKDSLKDSERNKGKKGGRHNMREIERSTDEDMFEGGNSAG
jgi:hypothetical protein